MEAVDWMNAGMSCFAASLCSMPMMCFTGYQLCLMNWEGLRVAGVGGVRPDKTGGGRSQARFWEN